jgi:hypothetical protein
MNKIQKIATALFIASSLTGIESAFAQNDGSAPVLTMDQVREKITEYKPGDSHLMIVGLTTFGFVSERNDFTPNGGGTTITNYNSLGDVDRFEFSPMFLWRQGNKVLLEFEPSYTGGSTLGVNWADVSYFVAPGCIVRAGYFVLPFGIYAKRLAAGWINKLGSDPIGMDQPGSDFGLEVEGGMPLGNMKWSYDIAVSNGFQMDSTGQVSGVGIQSPNPNKTVCGRLGLLPLSNSSLELGFSMLGGNLYTTPGSNFSNPTMMMYAFDLSYYKKFGPITLTLKGQYQTQSINAQNFTNPLDPTTTYTYNNNISAGFGQISVRPTGLENKLRNFELGYRYVTYTAPQASVFGQSLTETDIALNYWLSWRQVIKLCYENVQNKSYDVPAIGITGVGGNTLTSRYILQFSTEF